MRLFSNTLTFNRIKDGEDGKPGPSLVYAGAWREDVTYLKDDVINHYVHQVRNGKKEFYLLQSPQSLGDDPYLNNTQGSGDIWRRVEQHDLILARKIQADEIDTSNLVARHIRTEVQGPRIEASGSEMHIYGQEEHPNIIFGVNSQGYAVLTYYTGGKKLYDLGPNGLKVLDFAPEKWTEVKYIKIAGLISGSEVTYSDLRSATDKSKTLDNATTFWHYYAGGKPTITDEQRQWEQYTYKVQSTSANYFIDDGWYYTPPFMENGFFMIPSNGTGNRIRPTVNLVDAEDIMYPNPLGVIDEHPIHYVRCVLFSLGKVIANKVLIWNGDKEGGYQPKPDLP